MTIRFLDADNNLNNLKLDLASLCPALLVRALLMLERIQPVVFPVLLAWPDIGVSQLWSEILQCAP